MDELTRIALVGTSKSVGTTAEEHPADTLLDEQTIDAEEALLLRAAVRSIFDQSGCMPSKDVRPVSPAPPDEAPCGSVRLAGLLQNSLIADPKGLLIEFLQQMKECRVVAPYDLLPQALCVTDTEVREHLLLVLGERGRWLAGFQTDWAWVHTGTATLTGSDRDSLQSVWEHGSIHERCSALATIRRGDAAEGRSALNATFAQEKAEHRGRLLLTLEHGLSYDDEAFLESCLDDRSTQVREAAADLLVLLPGSALSVRMRERADAMLSLTTTGRLRRRPKLVCEPPETIDKTWNRDGIGSKPSAGRGKRAYLAEAVISAVPPSHWGGRFALDPAALVTAIEEDLFGAAVLAGWSRAAARFSQHDSDSARWLVPLWDCWAARANCMTGKDRDESYSQLRIILPALRQEQAEECVLRQLENARKGEPSDVLSLICLLPKRWGEGFAARYLTVVRSILRTTCDNAGYQWSSTLLTAAKAIPPDVFADALKPWDLKDAGKNSWHNQAIIREIDRFTETVITRKSFYEELAP
jgi:Family of unknown function (DUF5691)